MVDQSNAMVLRMAILAFGDTGPTRSTDKSHSANDLRGLDGCIAEVDLRILGDRGDSVKPLRWRYRELLIEWGFKKGTENLAFDGSIQSTHFLGKVATVKPLRGDSATEMTAEHSWKSSPSAGSRRGIVVSVLYADTVRGPGRTILTVRTCSGSFSFQPVDLWDGPILAPAHGFFVADISSNLTAAAFEDDLASKNLKSIRQMVREHTEQTWEGAMKAIHGKIKSTGLPTPPYHPRMDVAVPDENLSALWRIGAWQLIKNCPRIHRDDIHLVGKTGDVGSCRRIDDTDDPQGMYVVRNHPFPPLSCETERILLALDHMGMHDVSRDGISIWLENQQPNGALFVNSGIEAAHRQGALQIPWILPEHARLTGDRKWLEQGAPKLKAVAEWIINRRRCTMKETLSREEVSGIKDGTWSPYGLQPPASMGDSDARGSVYFFLADAFAYRSIKLLADALSEIDLQTGTALSVEVENYAQDLLEVLDDTFIRSPLIKTQNGTYQSFLPQGFQDRGPRARTLPEGVDVFSHCGPLAGDITCTSSSIDAWLRAGLLSAEDSRIDGHFDVLEDILLLDNPWGREWQNRTIARGDTVDEAWFNHAGFGYQNGWERVPDYYLVKDDIPNFLRAWLNRCAVDLNMKNWTFNEHTTHVECDKSHGNAAFLSNFRKMLVMELDESLWFARGTPRAWLEQGKRVSVRNAPTHFGDVGFEIVSDVDNGIVVATVELPSRDFPESVYLRLRHPKSLSIKHVTVNGKPWPHFSRELESIVLTDLTGKLTLHASY